VSARANFDFFVSGQGVEIAQGVNQVPQTAREAVIAVNHDGINPAPAAIRHQAIQGRAPFLAQWVEQHLGLTTTFAIVLC